ncbi:MlaD family protein [Helicobacter zhangjianzhongii]|uniref:MlaD family protein n=1 Tax=Helicobacter zhangjianzhongii TaxID=2974574 RepID=A0ACC6FQ56_9HELI|nr:MULTISPECIES: MlaD family protein [unclassified Helicobacter]MDL0079332.1 MlaD family protein [Helicobacter sp. CPD2-1]MDL0081363.1 MlaD family protein [Helicobacter sp. XJK30-2]
MERNVNYVLIGGIFFAILIGLIVFILWFGRISFNEDKFRIYTITTSYDISGIAVKTPIKYKGITIGHIKHIGFDTTQLGVVKITLLIQRSIPIAKGSSVLIDSQGLAGLSYLALRQNPKGEIIVNDDDAVLTLDQSFLGKLSDKADSALEEMLGVLGSVEKLLSEKNVKHISSTLTSLDQFSQSLPALSSNINRALESINGELENGAGAMIAPTLYQTQKSLQNLDILLQKTSNLLDKFDDNPYPTIFGEKK